MVLNQPYAVVLTWPAVVHNVSASCFSSHLQMVGDICVGKPGVSKDLPSATYANVDITNHVNTTEEAAIGNRRFIVDNNTHSPKMNTF